MAANFAPLNRFADGLKGKGDFRKQNDLRAAGDAGMKRNPARVAAHDFNEHDAMMAFGGGVKAVDGFGGNDDGGVETERHVGGGKIVVDGLGNRNDVHSAASKIARDVLRAIAA